MRNTILQLLVRQKCLETEYTVSTTLMGRNDKQQSNYNYFFNKSDTKSDWSSMVHHSSAQIFPKDLSITNS